MHWHPSVAAQIREALAGQEAAEARAASKEEECAALRKQLGSGLDEAAERVGDSWVTQEPEG